MVRLSGRRIGCQTSEKKSPGLILGDMHFDFAILDLL